MTLNNGTTDGGGSSSEQPVQVPDNNDESWNWRLGVFQDSWELALTLWLPLAFVVASCVVGGWFVLMAAGRKKKLSKKKSSQQQEEPEAMEEKEKEEEENANNDDENNKNTRSGRAEEEEEQKGYGYACQNYFYVNWKSRPTLQQRINTAAAMLQQQQQQQVSPAVQETTYTDPTINIRKATEDRTIGRISRVTERNVRDAYPNNDGEDDDLGLKVVLFLRLANVFVSSGLSSIENEDILTRVASALQLPPISFLRVGLTEISAQFQLGPVINISCTADNRLTLLSDVQQLADCILSLQEGRGRAPTTFVVTAALEVLDELERKEECIPYGQGIRLMATYVVGTIAPVAVYRGGYPNLVWAALITPALMAEFILLEYFGLSYWETLLVSFTTGLLSPILWQATRDYLYDHQDDDEDVLEQCVAGYTIGVLLMWLPGSSLVYGTHEIARGSFVNGSARLTKGIVQAMIIALFYTLGWQYWGQNWTLDEMYNGTTTNLTGKMGPIASLPPSITCANGWEYELSWYMTSVVFMLPLNAASMVVFNIHVRHAVGVFLVAQAVYTIQGALNYCYEDETTTCGVPTYIQTFLVAFLGGFLAKANHIWTGFSHFGTMLAIILILAPGAGAVRAILGAFHRAEGDPESNSYTLWESIVSEGVAYSMGFYLAFDLWAPLEEPLRQVKAVICPCGEEEDSTTLPGEAEQVKEDPTTTSLPPKMRRRKHRRNGQAAIDVPRPTIFASTGEQA